MVCQRCVMSVQTILKSLHLKYNYVILGEIENKINDTEKQSLYAPIPIATPPYEFRVAKSVIKYCSVSSI